MKIWLLRVGEPLPTDPGQQRPFRMGLIAEELVKRGADVLWWTSSFDHNKKTFRANGPERLAVREHYQIQLLHGCGYQKNASAGRFRHYAIEKKQFLKMAEQEEKPDIILAAMPNIDLAESAVIYGHKHSVPVFVDIRDMWPDIYLDWAGNKKQLVRIAIQPMIRQLKKTLRGATGLFATSDLFLKWGLERAERAKNPLDQYYYVSYPDTNVEVQEEDLKHWRDMGIEKDDFVCCFFGQFGYAVDLDTVMHASVKLAQSHPHIKFVICGLGEKLKDYQKIVGDNKNVIFPGWVNRVQICALGRLSHIGLLSYRKTPNFEWSMPNKFCEYLALGVGVLIQPPGMMEHMATAHACGYRYDDADSLAERLRYLSEHMDETLQMKANARALYDESFRADVVYGRLADHLMEIARGKDEI